VIHVDGKEWPWHEDMTVADLLKNIKNSHVYAVVRVNNTAVYKHRFDTHQIPDQAEILLIPMIAGG
jgi:thiamine biosynthesis protein ThiS